jgi:hypothetical protein
MSITKNSQGTGFVPSVLAGFVIRCWRSGDAAVTGTPQFDTTTTEVSPT